MSILASIVGAVTAVKGIIAGGETVAKLIKGPKAPRRRRGRAAALPALPVLPGAGALSPARGALPSPQKMASIDLGVEGPGIFTQQTPPRGFHLSKQPPWKFVRNRRMNPLNPKAFRRSVRRLKGAVKFAKEIDRVIPIRPRARRSAPRGHHGHLKHD